MSIELTSSNTVPNDITRSSLVSENSTTGDMTLSDEGQFKQSEQNAGTVDTIESTSVTDTEKCPQSQGTDQSSKENNVNGNHCDGEITEKMEDIQASNGDEQGTENKSEPVPSPTGVSPKAIPLQETPFDRHSRRSRKRIHPSDDDIKCPVCKVRLRPRELQQHLWVETEKLNKLTKYGKKGKPNQVKRSSYSVEPDGASSSSMSREVRGPAYSTYLNVKASREERLKRRGGKPQEVTCPVCNKRITGTQDEISQHVDKCLIKSYEEEQAFVDIEADEEFEEYEWAGQTRIRPSSMLQGGMAAAGFEVAKKSREDDDDDLVVDVDDDEESGGNFGENQYSEADVILCVPEKETKALRKAYLKGESIKEQPIPAQRTRWESQSKDDDKAVSPGPSTSASSQEIIQSLRIKIKELESHFTKHDLPKCLICMEMYVDPVVSTQCWHVHCEECWLRTLGAKKLCPQCNMITSPRDLRKVYL